MRDEALRVLIADDEYWVRQAILSLIDWTRHGFVCLPPAEDGEDAWAKIAQYHPHIVLLDIHMPFLSGLEVTKRVRDQYPDIAVLILSGYSDFQYVREALTNGAIDYLLKPADGDNLLAALSRASAHLLKNREERQRLDVIRAKSALASSIQLDHALSELMDEDATEESATRVSYGSRFAYYHLIRIRLSGLRRARWALEGMNRVKETIAEALHAKERLVFQYVGHPDTLYAVVEMEEAALLADCEGLLGILQGMTGTLVTLLISERKDTFRQLKSARDELKQLQWTRPYSTSGTVMIANKHQDAVIQNRVSAAQRRELELAARAGSRSLFQHIVYEVIGLRRFADERWLHIEVLHTLNVIGFILRNFLGEAASGTRALGLESLMELMVMAADRLDPGEAFSILEEMISECLGTPDSGAASEGMRQTIKQVKAYIAQNYFDELSLSGLALRFMVDDGHLSRTFKQAEGENLMLFIARTRIQKAQEYIAQGVYTLAEIASMIGYDDYNYFNRVFHKITGVSPRAYKEECMP